MPKKLKPGTSIQNQILLLRSRSMQISDSEAQQWLQFVSYYRLSGYWFPTYEDEDQGGSKKDTFKANTTFSDIVALYEADRKLRTLIHDAVERIEVAFRTQIINLLSSSDPLAYRDSIHYRESFDLDNWYCTALRRIQRAGKHNQAIQHYTNNYGRHYPLWVLAEVLDFSDISRLYQGLTYNDQAKIAEAFEVKISLENLPKIVRKRIYAKHPLATWLQQLTIVRNSCAHHARIWNKSFVPAPTNILRTIPGLETLEPNQSERIYGALLMIAFLLQTISPRNTWKIKMKVLINESFLPLPMVMHGNMGFPVDWLNADIWSNE